MSITIEMSPTEVTEMREITRSIDDTMGVRTVVREYVRWRQLCEVKHVSRHFDYIDNSPQL